MEFAKFGSEEDQANMRYVLHCKALAKDTLPRRLVEQIKFAAPHGLPPCPTLHAPPSSMLTPASIGYTSRVH